MIPKQVTDYDDIVAAFPSPFGKDKRVPAFAASRTNYCVARLLPKMPQCNTESDPPAPVTRVVVRNPVARKSVSNTPMLIDTGADMTLIPRILSPALGGMDASLKTADSFFAGFVCPRSPAYLVSLEIEFLDQKMPGDSSLTDDTGGVSGKDVLNQFHPVFGGPHLTWGEVKSP